MSPKRPSPLKPPAAADDWKITDEWGIYDPEKAGIPALFRRLGRPVLRAAPSTSRKERRRAHRPERSDEGVGLALAEAKRRAGYDVDDEMPMLGGNPARAMRLALKARNAVNEVGTPADPPYVPPAAEPKPAAPHARAPHVPHAAPPAAPEPPTAATPRRRARKGAAPVPEPSSLPAPAAPAEPEPPVAATKARTRRTTRRAKSDSAPVMPVATAAAAIATVDAPAEMAAAMAEPLAPVAGTPPVRTGPPAPSPRRPRGPVPLAAWARAVDDQPKAEPVRIDKRGFWRSLFRIPAEVALVEYAHGCRIHRLLVEAGDDHVPDFI